MTTQPPPSTSNTSVQIIICDTNIVILMTLFKSSLMFTANYSFGAVKVHQCVIDQLQSWLDNNNKKIQKFSAELVQQSLQLAKAASRGIKEPTDDQYKRSARYIAGKENGLSPNEKGMATDKVDQLLLILAYVNKAYLATQERTMTSIGKQTLPAGRVIRFEDLVLDLISQNLLSSEDIESGLTTLDHFKEKLDAEKRKKIEAHIIPITLK
jgi:rRNA-processing protein FCF1